MSRRRVTVVASELLGRPGTGGAGTADSLLAVALGRHGHEVELLIASGREIGALLPRWEQIYDSSGVRVRVLQRTRSVRPDFLAPTHEVFEALRERPPDVAIVNDWRGLGYLAMRARQAGVDFAETAFVVHCHGPGRVLAEFAQKVPDTVARFGEEVTERASVQLADAVVSPSKWLLDWMRTHGWRVPETARVVPYLREWVALGEAPVPPPAVERIRRLAFFGQLREGKGIRIFIEALGLLEPKLLDGVELVFLGSETPRWTGERIVGALPPAVTERVASSRVEASLDRDAALRELRASGTFAVMPSLLDNAPNTVSECIECGIPFVAATTGGIPELVADEDRERVLCRPTGGELAEKLRQALSSPDGFAPAAAGQDPRASLEAWLDIVAEVAPAVEHRQPPLARVAVVATGGQSIDHARRLAERTQSVEVEVVVTESRTSALDRTSAEWVVFLDDDDEPDDAFVERLIAAQRASGADAVTTAVRPSDDPGGIQLFLGDPGSLGLVENHYGVVGLARRELVTGAPTLRGAVDSDWPLFARAVLSGARIVSIPEPLSVHLGRPGRVTDVPGEGLSVLAAFEESGRDGRADLPQLAATLAAAARWTRPTSPPQGFGPLQRRARGVRERLRRLVRSGP